MTPRRDLFLAALAVAVVLAIVALLASSPNAPQPARTHQDAPRARTVVLAATPAPSAVPSGAVGTVLIGGKATWYDTPGLTAAAGPVLRDVLGDWRGRFITVEADGRSVVVQLTDWCACGERAGIPTLLDLSRSAFAALADPRLGVIRVSIEIDGSPRPDKRDDRMRAEDGGPAATVPPTSTEDVR